jgi:integrase
MNRRDPVAQPSSDPPRRLSYDVRIWKTRVVNGARGRSYQVRWNVAGKVQYATFATKALADSHESKLRTAAREGEAFDTATGLPLAKAEEDQDHEVSWYEFACAYVDMKWEEASPNSRRAIAEALATATPALLATNRGAPKPAQLRKALYGWAFNSRLREAGPPAQLAAAIKWIEHNTIPLADLSDSDTLRRVLNQFARKLDGGPAAATVVARKRAVLFNLLGYAVDKKHFPMNPLLSVKWTSPKIAEAIDRRRVVNPHQAGALLETVAGQGPMGRHLEAFFGCLYYAGLRPSEAVMLTLDEIQLPDGDDEWGWLYLGDSAPSSGGAWNETGNRRERRQLKHRAAKEVRPVPLSPALARLLRKHLAEYGTAPDGRLFHGEAGGLLSDTIYGRSWENARQTALSPAEAASPLGERPYDLRHARLSTWLNAGVAPAQVAEWAGNSVPVLLRVYAKCLADSEQTALRRIDEAEPRPDDGPQAQ